MSRFLRIEKLLGADACAQLRAARVTIVGLGAVGSYVTEALARAGIGHLRLVDFDLVHESNINRQLFALTSTVGQPKVQVAAARVRDINPDCQVEARELFVHAETLDELFADKPDLVVDAIDSLTPKVALLAGCYRRNIPVISSMGAALRRDPSLIRTADIHDTRNCPLAAAVRRFLRKQDIGRGIMCVYSTEPVDFKYEKPTEAEQQDAFKRGRVRNVLGSLPTLTGIFGLTIANMVINHIVDGIVGPEKLS